MDAKFLALAYGILPTDDIEVVNDLPLNTWLNIDTMVYKLQRSGGYRKSIPNLSNVFSMTVQPYYQMSTDEQARDVAAHVADVLRQDDFKTALCNLQARGRKFYIRHTAMDLFYAELHGWRSWEKSVDDECLFMSPCAIEVIRSLEDIQHEQLIDRSLLEICMTPIPDGVINPVNVEGKPYVVLKSLTSKDACITMCKPNQNVAILANGRLAYDVVAFCESYEEAQPIWEKALYK